MDWRVLEDQGALESTMIDGKMGKAATLPKDSPDLAGTRTPAKN